MSAIDRDILIKKYINPDIEKFHNSDVKIVLENLKQNILKMPSVDRPRGKWIIETDANGHTYGRCSVCNMKQYAGQLNFCPECGADMRKGADDEHTI